LAVLAAAAAVTLYGSTATPPGTAAVTMRHFTRHVRATGTVQPVEAVTIRVPQLTEGGDIILTRVIANGSVVKPDEIVAEFDRTKPLDQARDAKAKYEDLRHQVEQKESQHRSDNERRASELQQAEADLSKAQIELRKGPLLSEIDRLKAENKLEIAKLHVASLKKSIDARRRSETADREILALQRDRQKLAMERAERNADLLQIRAPIAGMVALEAVWRRGGDSQGPPQEGDQLWPGQALMRIFSSADMEVQLDVAEPDGAALTPGTQALVRLDAYPSLVFKAHFDSASPVASSLLDSPIRTFPARFRIDDHDPYLLPDLSAAVDIEVNPPSAVPSVPRAAVHRRGGRAYVTRVAGSGERREIEVALGAFDDSYVEVKSGLAEGDQVLLRAEASQARNQ
jgi:multidrug efflux pump subunit AcrA (membrane-fusion protein)